MILVSRIVLALLAALGAVYAGRTFDLVNRFDSSSYAYTVFGIIVFLAFAVGWMVGGIAGKGLARGFKRVERAAQARSAGELTVGAIGLLVGLLVSALLYLPVHALPYIGNWVLLPMVLMLAKERGMPLLTTDFNLNRLAQIQDVQVLNVNDLANALKPAVLPGERLDVLLIKEGKESNQGVGYLDDGTMVVVERARERIGETLGVQVTSVLQQPSGTIIFTKIADDGG